MDKDNPVVKLCIEGQRVELHGSRSEALGFYRKAWIIRKNDLDACIAAHFLAKPQKELKDVLKWNRISLKYARKVHLSEVSDFYPSLFINIADTYEKLGKTSLARKYYNLAADTVSVSNMGAYGTILLESIKRGLKRTRETKL